MNEELICISHDPDAAFFKYIVRIGDFNYAFPACDEAHREQAVWFDDSSPPEAESTFVPPPNETVRGMIESWGKNGLSDAANLSALGDALSEQYTDAEPLISAQCYRVTSA